jgi:hypothetical protein
MARSFLIPHDQKATILHLGGTTSSLSIIDRGQGTAHVTIPEGLSGLEQNITDAFSVENNHVASVMRFANDENILDYHRDIYYQRIEAAYQDLGGMLRRGLLELKRHVEQVPQPVFLMADPSWISVLLPIISQDTQSTVRLVDSGFFNERIIYSENALARNSALSVGILQAVKNSD